MGGNSKQLLYWQCCGYRAVYRSIGNLWGTRSITDSITILEMSKLSTLSPAVVRELCQHLNVEGAGVRNWRDLLTKVQGQSGIMYLAT